MPKAKPAKAKPVVAPKPPAPPQAPPAPAPAGNMPIVYPTVEFTEYSTTSPKGPLTIERMKTILWWETEKEYQARMVAENPGTKPEHWLFGENGPKIKDASGAEIGFQPIHCRNVAGEKVVCWNNAGNRSFDDEWEKNLIHTVLYGQWAGPFTIPGETINGEAIRISKYGRVLSGQHQMTACIHAGEFLAKARADGVDNPTNPKYPVWKAHAEPFLETLVITGLSEDPRVLMTVDYVKPRTTADVFYTSKLFKSLAALERKELCKLLSTAVDTLWTRTDARGYRTHPEVVAFLDRHRKLLGCVEYIYKENKAGRKISRLRLNPGHCAALMFIQASSGPKTDGDAYRNEMPPTEKNLDWSYWDKAEEFWTLLASGTDFEPVRIALGRLVDSDANSAENQGMGGRIPEKLALIASAWERWKDHGKGDPFEDADLEPGGILCLNYSDLDDKGNKLPDGQIKLIDTNDFFGIDCPPKISEHNDPPVQYTKEEMDKALEDLRKRREQK